jgi:kynurenine formamidase
VKIEHRIVDLSLALPEQAVTFPGDVAPLVRGPESYVPGSTPEFVYSVLLGTQTGTHVQGAHYFSEFGKKIDEYPLARFEGPAEVIDCRAVRRISADFLEARLGAQSLAGTMLLFFTGFVRVLLARRDGAGKISLDDLADKPGLALDGAQFLVGRGAQLLGIDSIGFEPYPASAYTVTRYLGDHDMLLVENMINLDALPPRGFWLECFPLPVLGVEGTPCRAIAKVPL